MFLFVNVNKYDKGIQENCIIFDVFTTLLHSFSKAYKLRKTKIYMSDPCRGLPRTANLLKATWKKI